MPPKIKIAVRRALVRSLWLIPLGIWEVAKDRAANMANKQIDDNAGLLMKEAVHMLEWMADQPLSWTLIVAVIVVVLIFLHAYSTNERPDAEIGQPTLDPLPLYRAKMEFHVIASLACGKTPVLPINSGPELQMLRYLKDAAADGRLQAANKDSNGKFYVLSQTTPHDLLEFCERHPKPENLLNFARQWTKEVQPRHYVLKAEPGAYQVTGKNAAAGVSKVNKTPESLATTTTPTSFYKKFCDTIELQDSFLQKLRPITNEHATIKIAVANVKHLRVARALVSTFDLSGWKTSLDETPLENYRNEYTEGIEVQGFNELIVNSLCAAFREAGFQNVHSKIEVSQIPKNHPTKWPLVLYYIHLTIGHE